MSKNLIEAKGSVRRNDIRMAVGQLLDYKFQGEKGKGYENPNLAVLLPERPKPSLVEWLEPLGIKIIWRAGHSFQDNAGGQFI